MPERAYRDHRRWWMGARRGGRSAALVIKDFALGQMAMRHQPPIAVCGQFIGMQFEKTRDLGFNGLGEQGSCALLLGVCAGPLRSSARNGSPSAKPRRDRDAAFRQ